MRGLRKGVACEEKRVDSYKRIRRLYWTNWLKNNHPEIPPLAAGAVSLFYGTYIKIEELAFSEYKEFGQSKAVIHDNWIDYYNNLPYNDLPDEYLPAPEPTGWSQSFQNQPLNPIGQQINAPQYNAQGQTANAFAQSYITFLSTGFINNA